MSALRVSALHEVHCMPCHVSAYTKGNCKRIACACICVGNCKPCIYPVLGVFYIPKRKENQVLSDFFLRLFFFVFFSDCFFGGSKTFKVWAYAFISSRGCKLISFWFRAIAYGIHIAF